MQLWPHVICRHNPFLKIGLGLAKKGGIGGGGVLCTWQLAWLTLAGPFLSILTQTGIDKAPLPFFFFQRSIHWSEALDHCKLANEWAWQRL